LSVLRLLLQLRYDVIHLHVGGSLTPREVLLGLLCSSFPWAKTVFTFHSGGYPSSAEGRRTGSRSLRAVALRRFDAVIAVNDEIAGFFRRLGVADDRIRLISPFGMSARQVEDLLASDLESVVSEDLRGFLRSHEPLLLTIGGLEPEYDVPTQIDALDLVREQHPGAGLVVVGDGGLRGEIERHVRSKPYAEHIKICGDVQHRAVLRLLAEADVFLRTTLYDGDAISIREALHLGTPVVATDNGMRPQGVELVPVSDHRALAAAIARTLTSGGSRIPVKGDQRGLEEVRQLYSRLDPAWRKD
jgi:glycosyltransferase involved in cell wall biosynthesis